MKKIQEELFKLTKRYKNTEIDEHNYVIQFLRILQSNSIEIKGPHLVTLSEFILDEPIFEVADPE